MVFIYRARQQWCGTPAWREEQEEALPIPKVSSLWFRVHIGRCESSSGFQGALDQVQGAPLSHDRIKTHTHFYEWKLFFLSSEWPRSEHSCYFALCSESLLIFKYWNSDRHSPCLTRGPFSIIVLWEEYSNSCPLYFFSFVIAGTPFNSGWKSRQLGQRGMLTSS